MKLIMLGPPGAGKGTQAQLLAKELSIPHISTGDIFRAAIKEETPMGLRAKEFMDKGFLVPDDIVLSIIIHRLKKDDCKGGYLLDGFPRTLVQAKEFDDELSELNSKIDCVVDIEVEDAVIVARMSGRRVCPNCGASYHLINLPPKKDGICDECGNKLVQRADDNEQTVLRRLNVYHEQTSPLKKYYQAKGKLIEVDGNRDVNVISSEILDKIGRRDLK